MLEGGGEGLDPKPLVRGEEGKDHVQPERRLCAQGVEEGGGGGGGGGEGGQAEGAEEEGGGRRGGGGWGREEKERRGVAEGLVVNVQEAGHGCSCCTGMGALLWGRGGWVSLGEAMRWRKEERGGATSRWAGQDTCLPWSFVPLSLHSAHPSPRGRQDGQCAPLHLAVVSGRGGADCWAWAWSAST